MLFDDADAAQLKSWIVHRLEDISDADSDVLADYVLALLRHEQGADEVRRLCVEQLDDFLREHTEEFVGDVFAVVGNRGFVEGEKEKKVEKQQQQQQEEVVEEAVEEAAVEDVGTRGVKRAYEAQGAGNSRGGGGGYSPARGNKAPRRGMAPSAAGRWGGRGGGAGAGGGMYSRGPDPTFVQPAIVPSPLALPQFAMPMSMPWAVPGGGDPISAFLAAAAWGGFPQVVPGGKPGEEKKVVKKVGERCKDYDEKGFCMKGDMCPYEHGMDHIVVPPAQDNKPPSDGRDSLLPLQMWMCADGPRAEYDPNNSQLFSTANTEVSAMMGNNNINHNNSNSNSNNSNSNSNRGGNPENRGRGSGRGRGGNSGRGGRGGRSDISGTGPSYDRSNSTLVVEHIPDDKLDETIIKEFFGEFGTVTGVELVRQKHLAMVKFERWDMARKAYDSPAPIFDNRFIKVFWLKSNPDQNGASSKPAEPTEAPPKLADEMEINMEGFKRKQEEAQRAHDAKRAKKKANEDAAKELERRKEELLKMQLEERRKLEEKLAKKKAGASASPPSGTGPPASDAAGSVKSKDDAATTAALKAQLQALEEEARALGIDNHAGEDPFDLSGFRGRGRARGFASRGVRGGYFPRGRAAYVPPYGAYRGRGAFAMARGRGGTLKLDNRTRKVTVSAADLRGSKDEEFRHYLMVGTSALTSIPIQWEPLTFVIEYWP